RRDPPPGGPGRRARRGGRPAPPGTEAGRGSRRRGARRRAEDREAGSRSGGSTLSREGPEATRPGGCRDPVPVPTGLRTLARSTWRGFCEAATPARRPTRSGRPIVRNARGARATHHALVVKRPRAFNDLRGRVPHSASPWLLLHLEPAARSPLAQELRTGRPGAISTVRSPKH